MYQHLYQRFLAANPDSLHFAAHSHHWWPDVTRDAQIACWDDAARWRDDKWTHLFSERVPRVQQLLASRLGSSTPEQLVFAPNTHEFVVRLFSSLPEKGKAGGPLRVLTTGSEFHSFSRQLQRLEETGRFEVRRVASEPIHDFSARFSNEVASWKPDMVFFSQVFFDSGLAVGDLGETIGALPEGCLAVIDGYHAFCAIPTDCADVLDRCFYVAGGYKYAQGGEGCCFLHAPKDCNLRPRNTGWFAAFDHLESTAAGEVPYASNGLRFGGATFDPSGLYRLQAVLELYEREDISIHDIHSHVVGLQTRFIDHLHGLGHTILTRDALIFEPGRTHGHFLTFRLSEDRAAEAQRELLEAGIAVDRRGGRLRFGFGLYHTLENVDAIFSRLTKRA